jgi:hypothetical protein
MRKFLLALAATIVVFIILRWQSAPLVTSSTPTGILALEFCRSVAQVDAIIAAWNITVARWSVIIDFGFLAAYGALFYFGCVYFAARFRYSGLRRFGRAMVPFSLVAPLLDVVENIGMLITLSGVRNNGLLQFTCYTAWLKFACAAVVVLYLLVSLPLHYGISKKAVVSR